MRRLAAKRRIWNQLHHRDTFLPTATTANKRINAQVAPITQHELQPRGDGRNAGTLPGEREWRCEGCRRARDEPERRPELASHAVGKVHTERTNWSCVTLKIHSACHLCMHVCVVCRKYGATPIIAAIMHGHKDVVQILLDANAEIGALKTPVGADLMSASLHDRRSPLTRSHPSLCRIAIVRCMKLRTEGSLRPSR